MINRREILFAEQCVHALITFDIETFPPYRRLQRGAAEISDDSGAVHASFCGLDASAGLMFTKEVPAEGCRGHDPGIAEHGPGKWRGRNGGGCKSGFTALRKLLSIVWKVPRPRISHCDNFSSVPISAAVA